MRNVKIIKQNDLSELFIYSFDKCILINHDKKNKMSINDFISFDKWKSYFSKKLIIDIMSLST